MSRVSRVNPRSDPTNPTGPWLSAVSRITLRSPISKVTPRRDLPDAIYPTDPTDALILLTLLDLCSVGLLLVVFLLSPGRSYGSLGSHRVTVLSPLNVGSVVAVGSFFVVIVLIPLSLGSSGSVGSSLVVLYQP